MKTKAQKFICRRKNFSYVDNTISTSDRDKPEMKGKTLTGIYKLNNDGVSIESSRTDYQEDSADGDYRIEFSDIFILIDSLILGTNSTSINF